MDNNSISSINKILNDKYGAADQVNKMYKDLSYFDQYGGSVFLFILLILILFVVISYSIVMKNVQPIKDNWAKERCKANVIPFAGLINAPEGTSATDFTQQNFTYCMQDILKSITGFATQPLTYITYSINLIYNEIASALNSIRSLLSNIRTNLGNITQEIMGRILNVTVPIRKMLIAFNDMGQKVIGILTSGLYTSLGTYYALKAFLGALVQIIIIILVASVAIIIGLWLSFAWPAAIAGTVLFVTIAIICAIVIAFLKNVLHVNSSFKIPSVPKKPKICFDKYTLIKMEDGSVKKISEINVGEKLWDYSKTGRKNFVTAVLKLDAKDSKMYIIDNIIVSETHQVKFGDSWILVKNHPNAVLLEKYSEPVIYCLNTTSKEITVGDCVFTDWDEVTDDVYNVLNHHAKCNFVKSDLQKEDIYKYFDNGFEGTTMVLLKNGLDEKIMNIQLGDVLKNGEVVYGIVEIYRESECLENNKLYHLLTDKKTFCVGEIFVGDYNSLIDVVLEKNKK